MKQINIPSPKSLKKFEQQGVKQTHFSCEELDQCAKYFGVDLKDKQGKYKSKKNLFEQVNQVAQKQNIKFHLKLPTLRLDDELLKQGYDLNNIADRNNVPIFGDYAEVRHSDQILRILAKIFNKLRTKQPEIPGNLDLLEWQWRYFEWVRVDHPGLPEYRLKNNISLSNPEDFTELDQEIMMCRIPDFYNKIGNVIDQLKIKAPYETTTVFVKETPSLMNGYNLFVKELRAKMGKEEWKESGGFDRHNQYNALPSKEQEQLKTRARLGLMELSSPYGWTKREIYMAIEKSKLAISSRQLHMLAPGGKDYVQNRNKGGWGYPPGQSFRVYSYYNLGNLGYYMIIYEAMRKFKESLNPNLFKLLIGENRTVVDEDPIRYAHIDEQAAVEQLVGAHIDGGLVEQLVNNIFDYIGVVNEDQEEFARQDMANIISIYIREHPTPETFSSYELAQQIAEQYEVEVEEERDEFVNILIDIIVRTYR